MKKILSLLALLTVTVSGAWADELTVHDGTSTRNDLPFYGVWIDDFSRSEMIYPASELADMTGANINSLTFYKNSSNTKSWESASFKIYMKEVSTTTLSAYIGMTDATIVYEGSIDAAGGEREVTITFTTPYTYNGGNLLIGIYQTVKGRYSDAYWYGETVTGASASSYNGSSTDNVPFNQRNYLPKTTFTYEHSVPIYSLTKADGAEEHGTIAFTNAVGYAITHAIENQKVTVTITPEEGYVVNEVSGQWYAAVAAARNRVAAQGIDLLNGITLAPVEGKENTWTFTMQRANAEISATYKKVIQASWIQDIADQTYSGSAQTPTVTVQDGSAVLQKDVDYTVTYSNNTNAGEATATANAPTVTITAVSTSEKYAGTATKTFTINPKAVTVTAKSEAFTYDGTAHSNAGYDVEGLVGSDAISAVVEGSITFPRESPVTNTLKSYSFTTGTAGNYEVTTKDGQLTMTKANQTITISAASQAWTYDGNAHTAPTVTVTSGSLFTGDQLVATATGSVTNVADTKDGNNPVKAGFKVMHGTEDVTENYVITTVAGKLSVNTKAVTITAGSKSFVYTGEAQTCTDYQVEGLVGNDKIEAVTEGSITFPDESPVANKVKSYSFTTGKAGNYSVETKDGELKMSKSTSAAITISAADGEWTYDGTAHTAPAVTVTGGSLLTGDELVATATGSVTNVADTEDGNNPVADGYKVMHGTEDVTANYAITTVAGKLTIKPKAVTVTAKSEAFTYDGTAHSNGGYDVSGLVGSDQIEAVTEGSITFPSESPVANKVKSYSFTAGTAGNYSVEAKDGQLTMTKANQAITISAASQSWTYDGEAHTAPDVTVTGGSLLTGDELVATATGSVTNVADTEAGNNPVKAGYKVMHGTEDVTENYAITAVAGTLTVTKAEGTIAFGEETVVRGFGAVFTETVDNNGDGTVSYSSSDETVATVDAKTGEVTIVSAPGRVTVTATVEDKENGNYTYAVKSATYELVVIEGTVGFTANGYSGPYDGKWHNISLNVPSNATVKYGNMAGNYDQNANPQYKDAGKYTVYYEVTMENYKPFTGKATVEITKLPLTVTADDKSAGYGDDAPKYSYRAEGFIGGESTNNLKGKARYACDYRKGSDAGEYTIGISGLTSVNYDITFVEGTLTVGKKTLGISWGETTFYYDGTKKVPTVEVTGLADGDGYTVSVSGDATAVGSYTATVSGLSSQNYVLPEPLTCDFTILREMNGLFSEGCTWATFVAEEDLAIPEGLEAYAVTGVTATAIEAEAIGYIPAGTAILLKRADTAKDSYVGSAETGEKPEVESLLAGSATEDVTMTAYTDYVLYRDEFVLSAVGSVKAGHAYLPAAETPLSGARQLRISTSGATAIATATGDSVAGNDWYDLNGRRIDTAPTRKGMFIKNGKKVIIK